jgi:hypothetical protein
VSNQHLDPLIAKLLESVSPSRSTQQLEVGDAIRDFSPRWDEAEELLDILISGLERKYLELDISELGHYCKYLKQAIQRLGDQLPSDDAEDQAYADYRARKAGL